MKIQFNIISKLKYSGTKRNLIIIFDVVAFLFTFILFLFLSPFKPSTTGIIEFSLLGIFFLTIYPIENGWLYKTEVIGKATITNDFIEFNNEKINWDEIRDIVIQRYITLGYSTTVSRWKESYYLRLHIYDRGVREIYLCKNAIDQNNVDFRKLLLEIIKIDRRIRIKLQENVH